MDPNRNHSAQSRQYTKRLTLVFCFCALTTSGCQNFQLPRIDPSGERLFVPPGAPVPISPYANVPYGTSPPYDPGVAGAQPPLPGTTVVAPPVLPAPPTPAPSALPPGISSPMVQSPLQTPQPTLDPATTVPAIPGGAAPPMVAPVAAGPTNMVAPALVGAPLPGLNVNPNRVVAPVGGEVVMIASLLATDGYLVSGDNVEWMISGDSVGAFVSPGERGMFDVISRLKGLPRKVDASYVVNSTVRRSQLLDRGTPVPWDDVEIQPGQAWVTVTSPVEGTTNLTVYAPNVPQWDRRQQSAAIHWVDAQWNFPPPAINPVGTRHTFTTSVSRQTDGSPIAGWIVRYEVVGGPAAEWETTGNTVVEVQTNDLGQASAELLQAEPQAGTNQVSVQIIRPADSVGGRKFVIGSGTTSKTWTQPNLCVNVIGPIQAAVGSSINYRIEATNPSSVLARNVVITDEPPRALTFANSTPPADASPSGQEWKLGDLAPGQLKTIDVVFTVAQAGNFNYCATITADGGLTAKDCATTNAEGAATRPLDIRINGPSSANLGSKVQFDIEVVNIGNSPATGLVITDTFDDGLEHAVSASPIEKDLKDLKPGESVRLPVTFRVTRPGQLCQQVEVRGDNGLRSTTRTCLTAIAPPSGTRIDRDDAGVTEPNRGRRSDIDQAPPPGAQSGSHFTVEKTGPVRQRVGEIAEFVIVVTNTGDVTLNSIRIADNYDASLEPRMATDGWVKSGGSIVWNVTSLEPGKSIRRQIHCECLKPVLSACNRVNVSAEGLEAVGDEACLEITAGSGAARATDDETPPAISPTPIRPDSNAADEPRFQPRTGTRGGIAPATGLTVSVGEQVDPVRVGGETTYNIVVSNKTDAGDKQVKLSVRVPETMTITGIKGDVRAKMLATSVDFEPVAELRAGESIPFEVRCRALEAGEGRCIAEATSQRQPTPVRAEEPTQVVQ